MENEDTGNELATLVIDEMLQQYLKVDDNSIETRKYLLECTLPTVVMGLEKLLKELMGRQFILDKTKFEVSKRDRIQVDKPFTSFDSLNYLGYFS